MPLPAQYAANLKAPDAHALSAAGDFLVGAQGAYRSPDRPVDLKATWPFQKGQAKAAPNAAGIVAASLVSLNAKAPNAKALESAKAWADARLSDAAQNLPMYDPDIEALAALAAVPGVDGAKYLAGARSAFELRHSGANGREIVERLFMVRKEDSALVGYDAAHTLLAALAVGEQTKAKELAEALAATEARWNVAHAHGFHLTSRAAVLEALQVAKIASPLAASLRKQVLAAQGADGSWGTRNTQATAYSMRALLASGDTQAAEKAQRFLKTTQLTSGAWGTFNDYLPEPFVGETVYEVTAEVLLALLKAA